MPATSDLLPFAPWSPLLEQRERRAAMVALGFSLVAHLTLLGLVRDWRTSAPPPPPPIQVTLLAPPPPPAIASVPAPVTTQPEPPSPAESIPPRPLAKAPPPMVRTKPAPEAPRISPPPAPIAVAPAAPAAEPAPAPPAVSSPPVSAKAPEPAPPPSAVAPVVDSALLARYGQTLSGLLARQQHYPRMAAARGWEGEVVLKLVIARKGSLVSARVVRSSGHPVLDENALALVSEVQPFPALPGQLPGDDLEVTVPVHYQLIKKG